MQSKVIITIDTEVRNEGRHIPEAFERYVLGSDQPNNYATLWLADTLKRHGFPGVFFLDVYGTAEFPKASYEKLCEGLLNQGHSVQLHTHPDRMYDRARLNMHEYSLAEQIDIVREGISLLKRWTGQVPHAHRAGRYGANRDTLTALKRNGIFYDSSFFFGRENCHLPFPMSNDPFDGDGVLQIPVTVAPIPIAKLGKEFPWWTRRLWKRYQKLDVNSMVAPRLCECVLDAYGKVPYIILFMHSFSFSKRTAAGFVADQPGIDSLKAVLQLIKEKSMPVVTFDQVLADFPDYDKAPAAALC